MKSRCIDYLVVSVLLIGSLAISLITSEILLSLTDPARGLPKNGYFDGIQYTWGHPVINNKLGFREREIKTKAAGAFRVMVLGDSLTWGAGLSPEERYTSVAEQLLEEQFPQYDFEVLNFGIEGGPTILEASILRKLVDFVRPDLVVIGFCFNDLQPKGQNWSQELDDFTERMRPFFEFTTGLRALGLIKVSQLLDSGAYELCEWAEICPDWETALNRTYQRESKEFQAFSAALAEIKELAHKYTSRPPVFLVLNSTLRDNGIADDYAKIGAHVTYTWNQLGAAEAKAKGFITADVRERIMKLPPTTSLVVNKLDGHPSAELNRVYAKALTDLIRYSALASHGPPLKNN